MPVKTNTPFNSETQDRIQQLKLGVDWHVEPPPTRGVNPDLSGNGGTIRLRSEASAGQDGDWLGGFVILQA
jgi:hypothetical protein